MLFVGCLVAAVRGWIVVAFACTMFGVIYGEARPLVLLRVTQVTAAVHGRFVVAFGCVVFCVVRGDARRLLLSPCNTHISGAHAMLS